MTAPVRVDVSPVLLAALEADLTRWLVIPLDPKRAENLRRNRKWQHEADRDSTPYFTQADADELARLEAIAAVKAGDRLVCRVTDELPDDWERISDDWIVRQYSDGGWRLDNCMAEEHSRVYLLTPGREVPFTVTDPPLPIAEFDGDRYAPPHDGPHICIEYGGGLTLHGHPDEDTSDITPELIWQAFPVGHLALNVTKEDA